MLLSSLDSFIFEDFPYPPLEADQIAKITEWNSILVSPVSRWAYKLAKWEGVMYSRGHCISLLVKSFKALSSGLLQGIFVRKIRKDWTGWFYSTISVLYVQLLNHVLLSILICCMLYYMIQRVGFLELWPALHAEKWNLSRMPKSPFPVHRLALVNNNPFL